MQGLIKKALAIIDGRLIKVSETNAMYTLSDGSKVNKKEINKRITVLREFIEHGVEMDEEVMALMNMVNRRKAQRTVQLIATEKALEREIEVLAQYETPCEQYEAEPEEEKVKVIPRNLMTKPTGANKRFICGYEYGEGDEEKFVMVFWNSYKEVGNGHGDLEAYYKEHHHRAFEAVSGGFFITPHHNDDVYSSDVPRNIYLFGRSSTFRNFAKEQALITEYGKLHNINFIFGKTEFEIGERSDIIAEGFLK